MGQLLGEVLPFAVMAAVSPTILVIVLLLLSGGGPALRRTWFFAIGGTALTIVFVVLALTLLARFTDAGTGSPSTAARIVQGLLAVALAALAIHQLTRPAKTADKPSRIKRMMAEPHPLGFIGAGAVGMLLNVSTLVMLLVGSHKITLSTAPDDAQFVAAAMLVAFAILPLVLPPLAVTLTGSHATSILTRMDDFTTRNQRRINAGVLAFYAVWLAVDAIRG